MGGLGLVEIVDDTCLDRPIALKVMHKEHANNKMSRDSFLGEAVVTARLQHPNIVPVYDVGLIQGKSIPYYTMKLIEGESLHEILAQVSEREPTYLESYGRNRLINIFREVCEAVSYAHSKGIVHSNIKPSNIMIGEFGEVLLTDWELAKSRDGKEVAIPGNEDFFLTDYKSFNNDQCEVNVEGSLAYLAPEQALGLSESVDEQTDVFLLGATLYHILTFRPPYDMDDPIDSISKAERTDFIHPRKLNACRDVPNALIDIMMKAMDLQKAARFKTVEEMANAIELYLSGEHVSKSSTVPPGTVLLREGDTDKETFILVSGIVDVMVTMDGQPTLMERLGPGSVFGELSSISHEARTATVIAKEECELLHVSYDLLSDELQKLPPWLEQIVISLAKRISITNKVVHPYVVQNCAYPVLKQVFYIFSSLQASSQGDCSASYNSLCQEISNNLALPFDRIKKVIAVLDEYELCDLRNKRFYLSSLTSLSELLSCMHRDDYLQRGLGISIVSLDAEHLYKYKKIHDALLACD